MNIVFDLDGTLIDSAPDIQFVASGLLEELGKAALTLEETRYFIGEGSAVFVQRMMDERGIEETGGVHAALLGQFLSRYEAAVDKAVFYPGVEDLLESLRSGGFRLGLCTNKPAGPTAAVLQHMGLAEVFGAVVAGGMVSKRKPAPDMLEETIRRLGGGATLYVGDSEIDAETAERAGVPFALFSGGYHKRPVAEIHHDWLFDSFDELPAIIDAQVRATITP